MRLETASVTATACAVCSAESPKFFAHTGSPEASYLTMARSSGPPAEVSWVDPMVFDGGTRLPVRYAEPSAAMARPPITPNCTLWASSGVTPLSLQTGAAGSQLWPGHLGVPRQTPLAHAYLSHGFEPVQAVP